MMDPHVIQVCLFAVGFVFIVSGLGDKPRGKKKAAYKRPTTARKPVERRTYQSLPRPKRR